MAKQSNNKQQQDDEQLKQGKEAVYADKERLEEEEELQPISVNNDRAEKESFAVGNEQRKAPNEDEQNNTANEEHSSEAERTSLDDKPDKRQTFRGRSLPLPKKGRDPKSIEDDVPEKALGLPEDSFLMDRKVTPLDMKAQMKHQQRDFVGSNVKKPRDFARIFERGKSTTQNPKLDMSFAIKENYEFRKEIIAQQMLRNLHSRDYVERRNAEKVFKEMEIEKELMEEIKKDKKAYKNEDFIEKIQDKVPHI